MAKRPTRKEKFQRASNADAGDLVVTHHPKPRHERVRPKNESQARYLMDIDAGDLIYALGPAGTGKTYIACARAAEELMASRISKIVLTRPVIEVGQGMGFLPGELEEKYEPYLQPVRQVLIERMGKGAFEYALKMNRIEPVPLGFMRGMTFNDCWVILDEAQNVTPAEMKMFLTRIGENCKVLICGDLDQVDIEGPSGLGDAVRRTSWIPSVRITEFSIEDVVRSGLVMQVLQSYSSTRQP